MLDSSLDSSILKNNRRIIEQNFSSDDAILIQYNIVTDELYDKLNKNIDKFIETLLGKDELRIKMLKKRVDLLDTKNTNEFKSRIYEYREFLLDMNDIFDEKRDSDILSIRDEILSDLNQFLYLLTFDK